MIERFIHNHDTVMFTICMDVVDSAFAPGVSAPAVLGIYPHTVSNLLNGSFQVKSKIYKYS